MSKVIRVDVIKDRDMKRRGVVYPGRVAENHHAEIHVNEKIVLFGTETKREYTRNGTTGEFEIVATQVQYRREFKVGDLAEFDSYNLDYHGKIVGIKPNTVIVEGHSGNKHMSIFEFDFRNHDLDLEASQKRNAQTSQEI